MPTKCCTLKEDTLFFDYETDCQFAPYAILNLIGFSLNDGPNKIVKIDHDETYLREFRDYLANPRIRKVHFNGVNYDQGVSITHDLHQAGPVDDVFFMAKTLWPDSAAYSMKYLAFTKLGDIHWGEGILEEYKRKFGVENWMAIPDRILIPYLHHDLKQLKDLYRFALKELSSRGDFGVLNREPEAYREVEIRGAYHLPRMIFNGIYIDTKHCERELKTLKSESEKLNSEAQRIHLVSNLLSNQKVAEILDLDDYQMTLTDKGHFSLDKNELIDLIVDVDERGKPRRGSIDLTNMVYRAREIKAIRAFYENFLKAADVSDCVHSNGLARIPTSFSQSAARSRRFISGSCFGINFQNINQLAKSGIGVPRGWIEGQVDLTSIEEVIHVFYTKDLKRRKAYEQNENYSAYVELCNAFYGKVKTKEEWDKEIFPANPTWSIYKAFKTAKLAANFGMGTNKFAKTHRVSTNFAKEILGALHTAQPAIRQGVRDVEKGLNSDGMVYDPFGHAYTGPIEKAYKVLAYRIQGTAASLLKMCLWDIAEEFEKWDGKALLCATVHDSIIFRLHKSLGLTNLLKIMEAIRYITTEKYSSYFDDIPLRSKPALSTTSWAAFKTQEFHWKDLTSNLKQIAA